MIKNAKYNIDNYEQFLEILLSLKNEKKAAFDKKIIFTEKIHIGLSSAQIKQIVKSISISNIQNMLPFFKHIYYEETIIYFILISRLEDLELLCENIDAHASSWADTDCINTSFIKKDLNNNYLLLTSKLSNTKEYLSRFIIVTFMNNYIDTPYIENITDILSNFNSEFYYVNMASSWFICELFIKKREYALKLFECNTLSKFTINKAVSKINDSYRVSKADKDMVKQFKK
ncbi:MAG: hypothetical protein LBV51_03720 [Acholeplasmatales bacterium]|jgi:hypothetical protein|nr:hypothetical protein [Acholeplasmatales bacterium]